MSDKPSGEAVAFASEWLGIDHEPQDWEVGIIGGDSVQVGSCFYNLLDDTGDGPPRSISERYGMEVELQTAFAELLDAYAAKAVERERARIKEVLEGLRANARASYDGTEPWLFKKEHQIASQTYANAIRVIQVEQVNAEDSDE